MRLTCLAVAKAAVATAILLGGQVHAGDPFSVPGQEIYDAYCGACHGFDGSPLLPNAPDFADGERMEKSDDELLDSILQGKGKAMPAWLGILSEDECEAVLQFIREQFY